MESGAEETPANSSITSSKYSSDLIEDVIGYLEVINIYFTKVKSDFYN